eukprot:COSAG06_NODE_79181_length_107_cov_10555.000000_1_plen_20_part_10
MRLRRRFRTPSGLCCALLSS